VYSAWKSRNTVVFSAAVLTFPVFFGPMDRYGTPSNHRGDRLPTLSRPSWRDPSSPGARKVASGGFRRSGGLLSAKDRRGTLTEHPEEVCRAPCDITAVMAGFPTSASREFCRETPPLKRSAIYSHGSIVGGPGNCANTASSVVLTNSVRSAFRAIVFSFF
jgi:hypothetical protein